jgi:hypothetical protein
VKELKQAIELLDYEKSLLKEQLDDSQVFSKTNVDREK